MSLPAPRPGLVIRYAFLWSHEAARGHEEGSKDRPCAIVVATRRDEHGDIRVIVAPITHEPPTDPTASIAIPPAVCRSIGLDDDQQWLRLDELNRFSWPGYDLRPLPKHSDRYHYGMLPRDMFEQLRQGILERQKTRKAMKVIPRD